MITLTEVPYCLQVSVTCVGRWYFPSIMCVSVSLTPPDANGDFPVIIIKRMTPRLHTSGREKTRSLYLLTTPPLQARCL